MKLEWCDLVSNCLNNTQVYLEKQKQEHPTLKQWFTNFIPGSAMVGGNASELSERQQSLHMQISETKHQISKVHICIHVAFAIRHKENDQLETVSFSSQQILNTKGHVSYSHMKSKQRRCHGNVNLCSVDHRSRLYKTWDEPTRPTWTWRLLHKESVNLTGNVPLAFSLYIHVNHD